MPVSPDPPARLVEKYDALLALRAARAGGGAVAPVEELRALARSFPGALRELERLDDASLSARRGACARARGDAAEPEARAFAEAMGWFHALLREALAAKRDPARASDEPALAALARAPAAERGARVEGAVLAVVAERTGRPPAELRGMLFVDRRRG